MPREKQTDTPQEPTVTPETEAPTSSDQSSTDGGNPKIRTNFDRAYKGLFSHPIIVQHLIEGWFAFWAARLNFSTLVQRHTEHQRDDHETVIGDKRWTAWRNDVPDQRVTFPLEFQAYFHRFMETRQVTFGGHAKQAEDRDQGLNPKVRNSAATEGAYAAAFTLNSTDRIWEGLESWQNRKDPGKRKFMDWLDIPVVNVYHDSLDHLPDSNLLKWIFTLLREGIDQKEPLKRLGAVLRELDDDPLCVSVTNFLARLGNGDTSELLDNVNRGDGMLYFEQKAQEWQDRVRTEGRLEGIDIGRDEGFVASSCLPRSKGSSESWRSSPQRSLPRRGCR